MKKLITLFAFIIGFYTTNLLAIDVHMIDDPSTLDAVSATRGDIGLIKYGAGYSRYVYDGDSWIAINDNIDSNNPYNASLGVPKSCKVIKERMPTSLDGYYIIDPDGDDWVYQNTKVYCDMTTDGGGWTFFGHINSNGSGRNFFTNKIGVYFADRRDNGTTYSLGLPKILEDTEMMGLLDTADPIVAKQNRKIVFYKYDKEHTAFNTGPVVCSGLTGYSYKIYNSTEYISGGTTNSCSYSSWYSRTVNNGAYLALFIYGANGNYWGPGMGGNNTWHHDGWWFIR